jgi:iron uptake system component EfeO
MTPLSLRRTIRLGYAGVAVLAVGVGALGVLSWRQHQAHGARDDAADAVAIAITDRGCEPDSLTVPAGRVTFRILNRSNRVLEWEILDGVMVVEERENIAPGLQQRLVARLAAGDYAITCGLLGNPRGRLRVAASAAGTPAAPDLRELVGPMAEYKVYLTLRAATLAEATGRLLQRLRSGADAREALAEAHEAYQRIRPASRVMQAELDTALDGRAEDFAASAQDPAFSGFRRLALETEAAGAPALAERLQRDVTTLLARLEDAMVPPDRMLAGAALMAREAADTQDDALAAAMLDGAARVFMLLAPPARRLDAAAVARAEASLATARQAPPATRHADFVALADALAGLRDTLGLR